MSDQGNRLIVLANKCTESHAQNSVLLVYKKINLFFSRLTFHPGSTICVIKPEILIEFLSFCSLPGETVAKLIKPTDNVRSIKGFAIDRVKSHFGEDAFIEIDQIVVEYGEEKLRNNQMLFDFIFPHCHSLVVCYKGDITFRQRQSSFEMEENFFALFEE